MAPKIMAPKILAPWEGIEPPTNWLTANCSTAELPRNNYNFVYKFNLILKIYVPNFINMNSKIK
jgi:hypothetical protein